VRSRILFSPVSIFLFVVDYPPPGLCHKRVEERHPHEGGEMMGLIRINSAVEDDKSITVTGEYAGYDALGRFFHPFDFSFVLQKNLEEVRLMQIHRGTIVQCKGLTVAIAKTTMSHMAATHRIHGGYSFSE
jgi:hypothetical protein